MCNIEKHKYTCGHAYLVTISKCRHILRAEHDDETSSTCTVNPKPRLKRVMQTSCRDCWIHETIAGSAHKMVTALENLKSKPTRRHRRAVDTAEANFNGKVAELERSGVWRAPSGQTPQEKLTSLMPTLNEAERLHVKAEKQKPQLRPGRRVVGPTPLRNEVTFDDLEMDRLVNDTKVMSLSYPEREFALSNVPVLEEETEGKRMR